MGKKIVAVIGAGILYKIYDHHQDSKQEDSKTRLHIELISGKDLLAKDSHLFKANTSDPYVVFKQDRLAINSKTVKKTVNPVFDDKLEIGVVDKKEKLEIEVFDHDLGGDDAMGSAKVDLSGVTTTPKLFEIKLSGDAGLFHRNHGILTMKLWFSE
eukprot:TRINITY_DN2966_c0_g1_i1.p2 TRINITY_DN2966_c0_g1~~TRINITY_DN2966_c0_g1_i1.p2  ORF type:complete len:156 (+),score=87.71 TRINITY_DN2966_c0_g1_i1:215-682(+)